MNYFPRWFIPFILAAVLFGQAPEMARIRAWRADIEGFASHFTSRHPAPFRNLPKAEFERRMEALKRDLPLLKNQEIAARWARIIADLGDEHTEVEFEAEFEAWRLPIEIQSYGDGTYIIGATERFKGLLGARLDRVEGRTMDELRRALKPYVAYNQEGWFQHIFDESFGQWPLLMDGAGILKVRAVWSLQGVAADGSPFSTDVPLAPGSSMPGWEWEAGQGPALKDQHLRAAYFFQVLAKEKVLYFRIRSCDEDHRKPFKGVLAGAMKAFRESKLERLVVDLRGNTGGSEALVDRLVAALKKEPGLRSAGNLRVLTDGAVFSAAAVAAWRLRHDAGALLVGEACGAGANHIGAVEDLRLPSGRYASYGTQIHIIDQSAPADFKSPIKPDLEIRITHEDVLKGRDPVLETALRWPADQ